MSKEFSQNFWKIIPQFLGKTSINARFSKVFSQLAYGSHFRTICKYLSKNVSEFSEENLTKTLGKCEKNLKKVWKDMQEVKFHMFKQLGKAERTFKEKLYLSIFVFISSWRRNQAWGIIPLSSFSLWGWLVLFLGRQSHISRRGQNFKIRL